MADVRLIEVGPRDGLQNQPIVLSVTQRIEFINQLYLAGFQSVEVGSMVRADRIPQMANSEEVISGIRPTKHSDVSVLVPNLRGFERIDPAIVTEIGVFTAASDTFNQHNINCNIDESLQRIKPLVEVALDQDIKVRGTVSCVAKCPYEGTTSIAKVVETCEKLFALGCYEIVLGDTIGAATPQRTRELIRALAPSIGAHRIALHAHDTYDTAIHNVAAALDLDVRVFDSAASGLGGCPYAPGAKGNVNSRTVIEFCESQGVSTGIDLEQLATAEAYIAACLS